MPLEGKNELARFVDKDGHNKICAAITGRLLGGSEDFIENGCSNFKPEDMFHKLTRNLTVGGCRFTFDMEYTRASSPTNTGRTTVSRFRHYIRITVVHAAKSQKRGDEDICVGLIVQP